jgi:hypothetical protein
MGRRPAGFLGSGEGERGAIGLTDGLAAINSSRIFSRHGEMEMELFGHKKGNNCK